MKLRVSLLAFAIMMPLFAAGKDPLHVGDKAPDLTVTVHTGEKVNLADAYAKGPVLIYFYPKAETPGCTKQACNLRDNMALLQDANLTIYGVSTDSVESQQKFAENHSLPFLLIADPEKQLGEAFGVNARPIVGVYPRQTFLIVDGKIAWHDPSAKPDTQTQDALAALEKVRSQPQG